MAVTTFAAIDIGSYNVTLEIFEISKQYGIRSVNQVRQRLELGKDAYAMGIITPKQVKTLCQVLLDFKAIMLEYQVKDYRACSTSPMREVKNAIILQEQIAQKTGIKVEILSNSEQRFLGYKSIASRESEFLKNIEKGTAIVDVGGGSIQISLFDKDALVTTQNMKLGNLRIRERLLEAEHETIHYEQLIEELIRNEILSFKKMHVKERQIHNVILVGDYFADVITRGSRGTGNTMTKDEFMMWYHEITKRSALELSIDMGIPMEYASLLVPSAVLYKRVIEELGADTIWTPGVQLVDGLAYDYAQKHQLIQSTHDFENDILMSARNIGKRYAANKVHIQQVDHIAMGIFDRMRKIHGFSSRERLLLKIAIMLHDCGKYISQNNAAANSANIIRATEIIGLSHAEREIIANVVAFNQRPFENFDDLSKYTSISREEYVLVAKLTAIFKLANAMDQSHLQKVEKLRIILKQEELILNIETKMDYTLENSLLKNKIEFFQEVYNITPVIKIKRM